MILKQIVIDVDGDELTVSGKDMALGKLIKVLEAIKPTCACKNVLNIDPELCTVTLDIAPNDNYAYVNADNMNT